MDIRLPYITATDEAGQLAQMKSYLYQLAEQLKYAVNDIEVRTETVTETVSAKTTKETPAETFSSIKALIIKSADIVEAYYDEIDKKLAGEYVAQSDFGTYKQSTAADIAANSTGITQNYTNIQSITSQVTEIENQQLATSAYIKTGLLSYDDSGEPIYGLEIGQTNDTGFDKFARFTADRLSFYDRNDTEVAYVSDYKLYITNAEVTGTLVLGRYKLVTDSGLAWKWG